MVDRAMVGALASRVFLASTLLLAVSPGVAEDGTRVESSDGSASVVFPKSPGEPTVDSEKTPGGSVTTHRVAYQADGELLTFSDGKLPRLAARVAGSDKILANAKAKLLSKVFGTETSSESVQIEGADGALSVVYDAPDLDKNGHPGYSGRALIVYAAHRVYVVNAALAKDSEDYEAVQKAFVGSFRLGS